MRSALARRRFGALTSRLLPRALDGDRGPSNRAILFDVIGLAAKKGAHETIDKADQWLGTTYRIEGETIIQGGLTTSTKTASKGVADHLFGKASSAAQTQPKGGITADQLAARAAKATHIPADRARFLASIKDAPTGEHRGSARRRSRARVA